VQTRFCVAPIIHVLAIAMFWPIAAAKSDDAADLLEKSRKLAEQPGHTAESLILVKQADDILQRTAPLSVQHARVLDEYAYLLMLQARERAQETGQMSAAILTNWRVQAEPITKRALLAARAATDSQQADIALALEMEAEALGQTPEARQLWEQSAQIRKKLVDSLMSGNEGRPERSYCDAAGKPIVFPSNALAGPEALASYQVVGSFAFVVGKDGRPTKIRLARAVGFGHDEDGAKSLSCWHFKPGVRSGKPVPVPASVDINYRTFWPQVGDSKQADTQEHSETVTPRLNK
jgi:hypothetical protein